MTKSIKDLSPEQQAEVLQTSKDAYIRVIDQYAAVNKDTLANLQRKAAILDELIELRGMATRGRWEILKQCSTLIQAGRRSVATTGGYSSNDPNENWMEENEGNAQAITEIMNKLEQER